jgi:hypothetical protein
LQRVQIGLVGLAAVLLVVTLANLVINTARTDASVEATSATIEQGIAGVSNATGANEPLADLGVTPTTDSTASVAPSVPDLEPDPRLRQRMDQDRNGQSRPAQ